MKILNINLKSPDAASLLVLALFLTATLVTMTILVNTGMATPYQGAIMVAGFMGASLASAFGVSVRDHGWRGVVLTVAASLVLMMVVEGLIRFA